MPGMNPWIQCITSPIGALASAIARIISDAWPRSHEPSGRVWIRSRPATNLGDVAYTSAEARQELLDSLALAIDQIGLGLAELGAAYEQLDEHNADRLEEHL